MKDYLISLFWKVKRFIYKETIGADVAPATVKNPLLEWPRNYRCICGSGKKFKKCCLNGLASKITIKDANEINLKLNKYRV